MKIKFTGMMAEVKKGGCSACGKAGRSGMSFISSKWVTLPSGREMTFHRDVPFEVSDIDGEWLTSWVEKDPNGMERHPFVEVE